jgi:hypothetical protein
VAVEDLLGEREALGAEDAAHLGVLVKEALVGGGEGLDGGEGSRRGDGGCSSCGVLESFLLVMGSSINWQTRSTWTAYIPTTRCRSAEPVGLKPWRTLCLCDTL